MDDIATSGYVIPRRETDTDRSYQALLIYFRLGPRGRSIRKTVRKMNETREAHEPTVCQSQVGSWSSQHDWVARCREADAVVLAAASTAEAETLAEARRRWLAMFQAEAEAVLREYFSIAKGQKNAKRDQAPMIRHCLAVLGIREVMEVDQTIRSAPSSEDLDAMDPAALRASLRAYLRGGG